MPKPLFNNVCEKVVFSKIYEKHAQALQNYLYYKFGEALNPRDVAQDAFITLWKHCKKVSVDKAKSYLYTVATNSMRNAAKHQKVVLRYAKQDNPSMTYETPEFELRQKEFLKQYQNALSNLTEEQRVCFLLCKAEGKKHQEIADELGVTKKVVEYRIYTAFKQLKVELEGFNLK